MKISNESIPTSCPEAEIFESVLSLNGQNILELGCGDAALTRLIATTGNDRIITATEVDEVQHKKNQLIDDLPNVSFALAGSEAIPAGNDSVDVVFMFKSLHHVPEHLMKKALQEVKRVLKPNGIAYISEPIFSGEFNEVLRLFHDEEKVRKAAFDALATAVNEQEFILLDELFFNTPLLFADFEQYAERVIGATHSDHQLSDELYERVKQKFERTFAGNAGNFLIPIRVDLLRKNG